MLDINERSPLLSGQESKRKEEHTDPVSHHILEKNTQEDSWWKFTSSCLLSVTLLSAWQNAVKAALSIHLDSDNVEVSIEKQPYLS